jgi:hypothetical protein
MDRQLNHRPFFAYLDNLHTQVAHQSAVEMLLHPLG